ncbi:hypothetical protein MRX96_008088 [Rhipicephalus microplus]
MGCNFAGTSASSVDWTTDVRWSSTVAVSCESTRATTFVSIMKSTSASTTASISDVFAIFCAFGAAAAGGRGGFGAHHALQSGGFQGGPLIAAAATPSFAAADDFGPPQPYSFSYDNTDEFGTQVFHNEQGDGSNAKSAASWSG